MSQTALIQSETFLDYNFIHKAEPYFHLETFNLQNRRYLGNKYKLLKFIKEVVDNNCRDVNSVADIFAWTGAVASAFIDKHLIINDNLYSNYVSHIVWFSSQPYRKELIIES
jgi:adenine-specific DNA-methyltransferase